MDGDSHDNSSPDAVLLEPASSIQPPLHGDTQEPNYAWFANLLRFAASVPSMVPRRYMFTPLSVWIPRAGLVWTPQNGVMRYSDGDGDGDGVVGVDGGFGGVPASGEAIAALPETTVGEAMEEQCAVCLAGYEAGDTLRKMPCSHDFHEGCIFGWLRISRLCPLCRFELPAETDSDSDTEEEDDNEEDNSGECN